MDVNELISGKLQKLKEEAVNQQGIVAAFALHLMNRPNPQKNTDEYFAQFAGSGGKLADLDKIMADTLKQNFADGTKAHEASTTDGSTLTLDKVLDAYKDARGKYLGSVKKEMILGLNESFSEQEIFENFEVLNESKKKKIKEEDDEDDEDGADPDDEESDDEDDEKLNESSVDDLISRKLKGESFKGSVRKLNEATEDFVATCLSELKSLTKIAWKTVNQRGIVSLAGPNNDPFVAMSGNTPAGVSIEGRSDLKGLDLEITASDASLEDKLVKYFKSKGARNVDFFTEDEEYDD